MKRLLLVIIILSVLSFTLYAENSIIQEMQKMQDVFNKIKKHHVDNPDFKDVITGAIEGMLKSLADPYSIYLPPKTKDAFEERLKRHFGGLGIGIDMFTAETGDTYIQIVRILNVENCPAAKAGLQANDIIIKIDDISGKGIDFERAKELLRGPVDSLVTLEIQRDTEILSIDVIRKEIKIPQVFTRILEENIGYLRLISFTELSAEEVESKVNLLEDSGIHSLILDLRNNSGGYLTAAVKIVDLFVDNNQLIVYTKDKNGEIKEKYFSDDNIYKKYPLVLLVNNYSASASEIVTGALKDLKRATIVGQKTFGKGSVQQVYNLNDESGLKLTIAKYYTPSGKIIHKKGIYPDFTVKFEPDGKNDNQVDFAVNILKSFEYLHQ